MVTIMAVNNNDELMVMSSIGKVIRLRVRDVSVLGRATQGVKLIQLEDEEVVIDITRLAREVPVSNGMLTAGIEPDGEAAVTETAVPTVGTEADEIEAPEDFEGDVGDENEDEDEEDDEGDVEDDPDDEETK